MQWVWLGGIIILTKSQFIEGNLMSEEKQEINYGPLTGLIGQWKGDRGIDIAPEPDGTERSPF